MNFLFLFSGVQGADERDCHTLNVPGCVPDQEVNGRCPVPTDRNKPCVFPFKYEGTTYNECAEHDAGDGEMLKWCSTQVFTSTNHAKE